MSKANDDTMWTPLEKAFDQARDLNDQAVRLARETATDLRRRSDQAVKTARKQSEHTLKLVRKNIEDAQKTIEERTSSLGFGMLPDLVQEQLDRVEASLRKSLLSLVKSFDIATSRDVDSLRRKVTSLEKKINELTRESAAA